MSLRDLSFAKRYVLRVLTLDDPTTERRCGYARCAEPIPYSGQGRPPEYCPDRRWEGNRTCKQLAAVERAGERAAALDLPLESFRHAGERFVPAAQALARQLAEVVAAVGEVRDGALARVGESDRAAGAAVDRARDAETAAARARSQRVAAEADRERAVQARHAAEAAANEVRAEAERSIVAAWQRVAAADHARGAAETVAAQATHRLERAEQDLVTQAERWEAELGSVRADRDDQAAARGAAEARAKTAEARAKTAEANLAAAEARANAAELRARTAETRAEAAQERAAAAESALASESTAAAAAAEAHERTATDLAVVREALADLRRELDQAVAARAATVAVAAQLAARADRADARLDRMLRRRPADPTRGRSTPATPAHARDRSRGR